MQGLDQRILGIVMLVPWAVLVAVKRLATGSLVKDRPQGGAWMWLIHIFNFSFLLVANPLAAVLLMAGAHRVVSGFQLAGLVLYVTGYVLLGWALLTLRRNYQVGGNPPRDLDELVTRGPYGIVRHPMYVAVLCISAGLACLTRYLGYIGVFGIYVVLILSLIPLEEEGLRRAYGERYTVYQRTVKRLIPMVY